jgi:hypothetical protein
VSQTGPLPHCSSPVKAPNTTRLRPVSDQGEHPQAQASLWSISDSRREPGQTPNLFLWGRFLAIQLDGKARACQVQRISKGRRDRTSDTTADHELRDHLRVRARVRVVSSSFPVRVSVSQAVEGRGQVSPHEPGLHLLISHEL